MDVEDSYYVIVEARQVAMGKKAPPAKKLTPAQSRAEVISWQSTLKQSVDVSDRD